MSAAAAAAAADYTGATSGASGINTVGDLADESRHPVFASDGGAPSDPACYHDLKAKAGDRNPGGHETIDVVVAEATGAERERLFRRGADRFPDLVGHARRTDRDVPVIVLTPAAGA